MNAPSPDQPMATFDSPATWQSDQLTEHDCWHRRLTDAMQDELLTAAQQHLHSGATVQSDDNLPPLGPELTELLQSVQHDLEHGAGAVRVLGLDERYADSPLSLELAESAFWLVCKHVGWPVSQSATGTRMFHVADAGFADDDRRARGPNTRKRLSFHTDRCDVIGFLCHRQAASGGDNLVVSSIALYNWFAQNRPDLLQVLQRPFLYQRHNVDTGNESPYCEQPVFSIHEGHFAANLLRVLIDRAYAMPDTPDMTAEQREALDLLESTAERPEMHYRFRQQPGEMLLLNNFVTLHRRTEFTDHTDPDQRRLLLRCWLSVPNSRPLAPAFAGNYGATAAGAIRGGMRAKQS